MISSPKKDCLPSFPNIVWQIPPPFPAVATQKTTKGSAVKAPTSKESMVAQRTAFQNKKNGFPAVWGGKITRLEPRFLPIFPNPTRSAKTHCQHNLRFGIVASKADSWAKTRRLRWLTRLPFFAIPRHATAFAHSSACPVSEEYRIVTWELKRGGNHPPSPEPRLEMVYFSWCFLENP